MNRGTVIPLLSALTFGISGAVCCGYLVAYAGYKLLYLAFSAGHSGDPSIGDSVGWMIVFAWPLALFAVLATGITTGVVIFLLAYKKLSAPTAPIDEESR